LIALTVDDGPYPVETPLLLSQLRALGVRATFFLIGRDAVAFPELTARIERDGNEIANHTMTHPNLATLVQIFVPIDDEQTMVYSLMHSCNGQPVNEEAIREDMHLRPGIDVSPAWRPNFCTEDGWIQNREAMKRDDYTGIQGFPNQDVAVQDVTELTEAGTVTVGGTIIDGVLTGGDALAFTAIDDLSDPDTTLTTQTVILTAATVNTYPDRTMVYLTPLAEYKVALVTLDAGDNYAHELMHRFGRAQAGRSGMTFKPWSAPCKTQNCAC